MAIDQINTKSQPGGEEITLNDVRDAALILDYIRRQAISIYEEAARPDVDLNASPILVELHSIPQSPLPAKVLPARQEWLVFYLGTMETVIRQLAREVAELETGTKEVTISDQLKQTLTPLWEQWATRVTALNKHLDELVPLFDNAARNNTAIQKVAVSIYDDTNGLEETRRAVFTAIQKELQQYPGEKVIIKPADAK
jgi:hypothetical protein